MIDIRVRIMLLLLPGAVTCGPFGSCTLFSHACSHENDGHLGQVDMQAYINEEIYYITMETEAPQGTPTSAILDHVYSRAK